MTQAPSGRFVASGAQEYPPEKKDTKQITRIFPIDVYDIPRAIVDRSITCHFIRVPLLGQHNPIFEADDWCGRTSSSMLWNYYKRAIGGAGSEDEYITHWVGPDGGKMNLRYPGNGKIAFVLPDGRYALLDELKNAWGIEYPTTPILSMENNRDHRLADAEAIRGSVDKQREALSGVLQSLKKNNPVVLHSGFSTSHYGGHIIVVCGFCEMRDRDDRLGLWLLIADPAPPKTDRNIGPRLKSVKAGDEHDADHLNDLEAGHSLVMIKPGSWTRARGYLYLVRASKLFEKNTVRPDEKTLWLDDLCNSGKWGGNFLRRSDATPLAADLVVTKNALNAICFPVQENEWLLPGPMDFYARAESAGSGFYPLGLNLAPHAGIHLPPTPKADPDAGLRQMVRSIAPGYIVAARLAKARPAAEVTDFVENENGFVLVRHELQETGATSSVPFYSLYMHLPPTKWPELKHDPFVGVPWLRRFYLARNGALINLDPERGAVGSLLWLAQDANSGGPNYEVYVSDTDVSQTEKRPLRDGDRQLAFIKAPGGDLKQAWDALGTGAVVTFAKPFLIVRHGEYVGYTQKDDTISGNLHWEIFAPAGGGNAVEKILGLANSGLGVNLAPSACQLSPNDQLLDASGITALLKGKLPTDEDKDKLEKQVLESIRLQDDPNPANQNNRVANLAKEIGEPIRTPHDAYPTALAHFMSAGAAFATNATAPDLIAPRFSRGLAPHQESQVYALTVEIDNGQYPVRPPPNRSEPYVIAISYSGSDGGEIATAAAKLTVAQVRANPIVLKLKVPAAAVAMTFTIADFHLDPGVAVSDATLAKDITASRWRGVSLEHETNWSPSAVDKLVRTLWDKKIMGPSRQGETVQQAIDRVKPIAWYGAPRASAAGTTLPIEVPIVGPDGKDVSLFASDLPASPGSVRNLHPITFLWLLKLLQENDKCKVVSEFAPAVQQSGNDPPAFLGWCHDGRVPIATGRVLYAVAIRKDWGSGPFALVARNADEPRAPVVELAGECTNGIFVKPAAGNFWGRWTLEVQGGTGTAQSGAPALAIPKPGIAPAFALAKDPRTDLYSGTLQFTDGCPDALAGHVIYDHAKVTLPDETEVPQAANWILDDETASFVIGLRNHATQLTRSFTLNDYTGLKGAEDRVNIGLCKAVEKFRQACRVPMRITSLSDEGCRATAEPIGKATVADLEKVAQQQGTAYGTSVTVSSVEKIVIEFAVQQLPARLQWTRFNRSNSVLAQRVPAQVGLFLEEGGFILGLKPGVKDAKLSPSFLWSRFARVAQPGFRIGKDVAPALEKLSLSVKGLVIRALSSDGLSVSVQCAGWDQPQKRQRLLDAAKPLFASAELAKRPVPLESREEDVAVLSVVFRSRPDSGSCKFDLDPRILFGEVLRAVQPAENERVWLKAQFVAMNGHSVEVYEGPSRTSGDVPPSIDAAEHLRCPVPGVFKSLAKPGFGKWSATVDGQNLVVRLALIGRKADWAQAKPEIVVDGDRATASQSPGPKGSTAVEIALPLGKVQRGKSFGNQQQLKLEASVTNADATFDDERIEIRPPDPLQLSTVPAITNFRIAESTPGKLALTANVHCCPTNPGALKVLVTTGGNQAMSAKERRKTIDSLVRKLRVSYPPGSTLDGEFSAELDRITLEPGTKYDFEIKGAHDEIFGATLTAPATASYLVPAAATTGGP